MCLRLSFLVEVQRPAAFQSGQCSYHAAFLVGRAGQLPCCFSSGQCSFSCLFGATGRWRCQVGGRHLPIVSYGQSYKQTYSDTGFSEPTVFAHLNRIVSLHILSGRLSSNSCSAVISRVLCYAKNSLFCFRPFPETTFLERRRRRGAVLS